MRLQTDLLPTFEGTNLPDSELSTLLNTNYSDLTTPRTSSPNWVKCLSSGLTAIEQAAPYFTRDPHPSFVHLQCTEAGVTKSLSKVKNFKAKRSRERSPENSFSQEHLETSPFKAPFKATSPSLTTSSKHLHRPPVVKQVQYRKPFDDKVLSLSSETNAFCRLLENKLEELSVDYSFISWIQTQAKLRGIGPQEVFDKIRTNFLDIYSCADQICYLLRLASASNTSHSLTGANFPELRSVVMRVAPSLDWVLSNFTSSEINLLAPSWNYVHGRLTATREYTDVLEDMLELPSHSTSSHPNELLSYLQSKVNLYKDVIREQGQPWKMIGLPTCSQLLNSVKDHLIALVSRSITSIISDSKHPNRQTTISEEMLNNWIDGFKIGLVCIQLVGPDQGNVQNLLYQLLTQLLISSSQDLDYRLSKEKKDRRDWELWLLARVDIISGHLHDLTQLPSLHPKLTERSILNCAQYTKDDGHSEAHLSFALVDLILRIVHSLTYASVYSDLPFSHRKGFIAPTHHHPPTMNLKPSSYLLFAQTLRLLHSALPYAHSPSLESRVQALADHLDLALC